MDSGIEGADGASTLSSSSEELRKPLPSWPQLLLPAHNSAPFSESRQRCEEPNETVPGMLRSMLVGLSSQVMVVQLKYLPAFLPQQIGGSPTMSRHAPSDAAFNPRIDGVAEVDTDWKSTFETLLRPPLDPWPICPSPLAPQQ